MSMALAVYAVPADLSARVVGSRSRGVLNRVLWTSPRMVDTQLRV